MRVPGHRLGKNRGSLPLVMLPGTLCDTRVFGPLQQRLQERAPGLETNTCLTPHAGSLQQAAEQVLAEAPERFALLGFSLGGLVAMETALQAPERIQALALISTTPLPVPPQQHDSRRAALDHAQAVGLAPFVHGQLWPQYGGTECHAATTLPLLQRMAESLGYAVFARQTEMALGRSDFRPRLAAVRCPALVVAGTEDPVCPPTVQQELAAALADCTCVMLPGAGHLAVLEQPDEVASAVAAWFHTAEQQDERAGHGKAGHRAGRRESE